VGQDIDLTKLDQNSIVSRNHAEIFFENGRYWIKDLGSKNGTFLNGQKILSRPVALRTNDVLHFGSAKRGVKLIFTCK
jgi:pSer/pThr/pTyr-binding forkhead associated (FHA) protein